MTKIPFDDEEKTGYSPVALSDHTQKEAVDSATCHLSSVVEQRFRKPLETREAESTSSAKPVEARNAAISGDVIDVMAHYHWLREMQGANFTVHQERLLVLGDEVSRLQAALDQMTARAHDFGNEMTQNKLDVWKLRQDLKAACDNAIEFKNGKDEMRMQRDENLADLTQLREQLTSVRDEHHDLLVRLRLAPKKTDIPYNGY